jgi:chromosome segregation ATPase
MKADEEVKTSQARGAQTKIKRTQEKILAALDDLLREVPASEIRPIDICRRAGLTTDPYYAAHHSTTRDAVGKRLSEQIQRQAGSPSTKRRRLPISMTAQQKIEELEGKLAEMTLRHQRSVQALNVLSQVIDALRERVPEGTAVIKQLPQSP